MSVSFTGLLAMALVTALLSLPLLSLALTPRWRRGLRRLRRQLLGRAWRPVLIEPYDLPEPPKSGGGKTTGDRPFSRSA